MTTIHTVRAGQVYESCQPTFVIDGEHVRTTIRIVAYTPGMNRAGVVDAATGKRPRSILVSALHGSGVTASGTPRRTGYRLVQDAPDSPDTI